MGVQKHNKTRVTKKSCRKVFTKKSTKKSGTDFFAIFLSRLWPFLGEGSSKHDKKSQKNLTSPGTGTFLASEEPTNPVGARHFVF
jgi:hypothetical protein